MRRLLAGLAVCLAFITTAAHAQTYPARPITIVVPFAPGSGTDSIARIIGQYLQAALNQSVVIENKVGASGVLAATYVARAAPDGYTLLMATNSTHSANPYLFKSLSYDPVKDFAPVARIGSYVFMLVVNKDVPAQTLQELIAYAKANPGKLTYASGNTTGIVAGETFKSKAGVDILHVPYKSTPPAINDVLGGRVSMMVIDMAPGLEHVRAGNFRALAVTTKERSALLPDLPSLAEAGIPGYDVTSYAALFAPAGTPKDVVDRLNAEVQKIIANPEAKARIAVTGFDAFSGPPETLAAFIQSELVNWAKLIKESGIEPQ
ncbi:MAG: putative tricarboxylic transport rane protein [Hyphomicrobiales bacterium]|jgi:tripartite-type tricarboxylate transporter receptor subunit TctC|nr:putative tricarboxylic transport rane protein [Hyphomicrobiales bacterium]